MRNSNMFSCWCAVAALVVLLPACRPAEDVERTSPEPQTVSEAEQQDEPVSEPQAEVQPEVDARVTRAFDQPKPQIERYHAALSDAAIARQNVLVIVAPKESDEAAAFIVARMDDRQLRRVMDNYQMVAVDTSDDNFHDARPVLDKLEIDMEPGTDALVVVADSDGGIMHQESLGELVEGMELDTVRMFSLLTEHAPEPLDANELLTSALADAVAHDKRVIVQETATWCGPCWRLSRYFHANKDKLEEEYILVKMDHRWTDAEEIMEGIRDGASGGIPWWAIMDAEGQVLITSNNEEGNNIGFPGSEAGQAHYRTMLETTSQRWSEEEIDALVEAVN